MLEAVDPRLASQLRSELRDRASGPHTPLRPQGRWVLVGHRSAGKSRLLPLFSKLTGLPGVDLDLELERQSGRALRDWVQEDPKGFRAAERALFLSRPANEVDAVGGGFLALHGELLAEHTPVLVPITFETYRERLLSDRTRPRLRPELSIEEELSTVFHEREALHARVPTISLVDALLELLPPEELRA